MINFPEHFFTTVYILCNDVPIFSFLIDSLSVTT